MTAPASNLGSLRLVRLDTSRLAWAFALSVAVHLIFWGTYAGGKKLGLWEKVHLPAWVQKLIKPPVRNAKQQAQQPPKESEPPLMFVDVAPDQATTEPPKDAKYYSSLNSLAANPEPDRDTNVPKIDGKQEQVPKTEDAERNKYQKLQPALPAKEPEHEEKPKTKPEPTVAEVPPAKPPPDRGDLVQAKPQEKEKPGDLALAPTEAKPVKDVGSAEKPRIRRLAEVAQNKIVRPPGQKMKQAGGVKRLAMASLDAKATPFGAYDALFIDAVRERWYDLLESREYASEARGHVSLQFKLHHDGRITDMKVVENNVSETLSLICQKAVLDPAPFEKWPSEMRLMVGADFRRIQFTFYYN